MKRTALLATLTLGFALVGGDFTAHAAGSKADEAFQNRLFGHTIDAKQIHACFSRVYDAGHLAQHPQQNVRTMLLLVGGNAESGEVPTYGLRIGVTFRKSGTHFESAGDCNSIHDDGEAGQSSNAVHCGVDCDGGSIDVAIKDAKSVLVSIPYGARIWRAGSAGEEQGNSRRRFGADDKVFRLDKVALTQCLRLADDSEEKAMLRRGQ
jgi:hypothetical protein